MERIKNFRRMRSYRKKMKIIEKILKEGRKKINSVWFTLGKIDHQKAKELVKVLEGNMKIESGLINEISEIKKESESKKAKKIAKMVEKIVIELEKLIKEEKKLCNALSNI